MPCQIATYDANRTAIEANLCKLSDLNNKSRCLGVVCQAAVGMLQLITGFDYVNGSYLVNRSSSSATVLTPLLVTSEYEK